MNDVTSSEERDAPPFDFLTNHAHVLVCVARDPGVRLRDIADSVGITERATHRILSELVDGGFVIREKEGRRNRYQVVTDVPLPHPLVGQKAVGDLLELLVERRSGKAGDGKGNRSSDS
ncbi:MAG: MarR family winged helix-turn-helix transcriptional regulator [Actinomycetota bacterium]|nr:MarR family winged helix-turn-helix transcriptional regulator [Actinomycetota bacterium]